MSFLDRLLGRPDVKGMKERGDVDGLITALSHSDQGVRQQAAKALGELKDQRAVAPLLEIVQSDPRLVVRFEAEHGLRSIGGPGYIQALRIELEDKSWYVHSSAADELERIAEESADPGFKAEIAAALKKTERDEDRKLRNIRALKDVPEYKVIVAARGIISWPNACCVCLGSVEKRVKLTGSDIPDARGRYTMFSVEGVPYCRFCSEHKSDAVWMNPSWKGMEGIEFSFKNPEYGRRFVLANQPWGARAKE